MIIRGGRIHAAGCFLPLSSNTAIINDLGTRHRAAIGISEVSDAVVIVVSEETGIISVACEGTFKRDFTAETLRSRLKNDLIAPPILAKNAFTVELKLIL
ncbi:MAG: diadenylate cyclase [Christensenellaceae bacterium]